MASKVEEQLGTDMTSAAVSILELEDEPPIAKPKPKSSKATTSKTAKSSKTGNEGTDQPAGNSMMERLISMQTRGLATSLAPLSNLRDIFSDTTRKALGLGLEEALRALPRRPIRVATMCSGTESPLLALQMIQEALKDVSTHQFEIEHAFSAEIVPFKQAYIERNFAPPLILRDITEFVTAFEDEVSMATTAYGAKVPIPLDVDIVIAGTSCVDYSSLNNKQKDMEAGGESVETWYGALAYCKACRPSIIIFENVVRAHWNRMLEHYREIDYDCAGVIVDTKDYYLPQTRQRGYMVCFDTTKHADVGRNGLGKRWKELMKEFKRPASTPVSDFLLPNDRVARRQQHRDDDAGRELDWALCEIRQMKHRQTAFLGLDRPFTNWQESGAVLPADNADRSWYARLVEREKDSIDCVYLRASLPRWGMVDARYKTKVFDISQNIDRIPEKPLLGIISCITPDGKPFISDANRLITPEESLVLQGLPLNRISFTTEAPAELKDLAGNAMTTTVVGVALLSSLIVGYPLLKGDDCTTINTPVEEVRTTLSVSMGGTSTVQHTDSSNDLDLRRLLKDSQRASRRCYCEGSMGQCKADLQQCTDCGHTTCTSCGGNPAHSFRPHQLLNKGRLSPEDFMQQLRSQLPIRLSFAATGLVSSIQATFQGYHKRMPEYLAAINRAVSEPFGFQGIRRTHCWTASYISDHARVELTFDDGQAFWRLFALVSPELSCVDWLRISLEQPIGQALVEDSLWRCSWTWRLPVEQPLAVEISPLDEGVSTWWARNGLPWFCNDRQPGKLLVQPAQDRLTETERAICGEYRYLPKCGMASDSLYMKSTSSGSTERPIFLFLDPTRTGPGEQDRFVFSHNKAVLEYDETRSVPARVKAPWRPWPQYRWDETKKLPKLLPAEPAEVVNSGELIRSSASVRLRRQFDDMQTLLPLQVCGPQPDLTNCNATKHIISCACSGVKLGNAANEVNLAYDTIFLSANAWIFEALHRDLDSGCWNSVTVSESDSCSSCAPEKPEMRWKLSGNSKSLEAYEDPVSTGVYERAIKGRPLGFVVSTQAQSAQPTRINIGVNVASLAHRALARMPDPNGNVILQWKLDTSGSGCGLSNRLAPKFRLLPTTGIQPYDDDLRMSVQLFKTQRLALAWLRAQEQGTAFTTEEAEEAVLPVVNWRAEVRAETGVTIRGGICADHPGFGKKITSLALIQAESLTSSSTAIKRDLRRRQTGASQHLLTSSATLIICPRPLIMQWKNEAIEKLRSSDGICTINDTGNLADYSVSDFLNAKIILVNRAVFGSKLYADRLATFAGTPGPAAKSGRAFTQWLDFALKQDPEHV